MPSVAQIRQSVRQMPERCSGETADCCAIVRVCTTSNGWAVAKPKKAPEAPATTLRTASEQEDTFSKLRLQAPLTANTTPVEGRVCNSVAVLPRQSPKQPSCLTVCLATCHNVGLASVAERPWEGMDWTCMSNVRRVNGMVHILLVQEARLPARNSSVQKNTPQVPFP
eukprot:gnl/TRDRNA2_/TRDRNA2_155732_c0_seq3.p2 gnl/TRDRNA2_/TRDRNA2_155732_c0~~gnl/TRDRNA2_/TRDRNA2_155732_c0_seq3.p2  ORF type:complete len:168 (+),score=14.60 gnl/TRDRNA2_/TRDRNA2_155732_c0_seq3:158-661(+)